MKVERGSVLFKVLDGLTRKRLCDHTVCTMIVDIVVTLALFIPICAIIGALMGVFYIDLLAYLAGVDYYILFPFESGIKNIPGETPGEGILRVFSMSFGISGLVVGVFITVFFIRSKWSEFAGNCPSIEIVPKKGGSDV